MADPGKLAQIAYGLLPRDIFISFAQDAPGIFDRSHQSVLIWGTHLTASL